MRNIRYYPVMDCGGFGGNWYWNHHITPPPNYGNGIGLFSLAYIASATTTNIYTYSSNTVTLGTNLLTSNYGGCGGAGNSQLAVINVCLPNNQYSTNTNIYDYSTNNVVIGTAFRVMTVGGAASGNTTMGIYIGASMSNAYNYYQQYMYANNTTSITIYETPYYWGTSSTGTSTFGLFNLGAQSTTNNYAMTNIYQYSTNTISNGTNIFSGISNQAYGNAAGNATMGVFNAGNSSNSHGAGQFALNIYTYSSNAVTTGVALSALSSGGMATGNDIEGIFTLGNNVTTTNVYTYNNNTVVVGTNLTAAGRYGTGTSNHNPGVNT